MQQVQSNSTLYIIKVPPSNERDFFFSRKSYFIHRSEISCLVLQPIFHSVKYFNYFYFIKTVVVVKKFVSLFSLFIITISSAQQNEEFKMVKNYYDYQRLMLNKEFKKRFDQEKDPSNKVAVRNDFQEFMVKLDSIQNSAFVNALVKVKIREDLSRYQLQTQPLVLNENPKKSDLNSNANYPGGFNLMKQQIVDLFYTDAILADQKMMKTDLLFVVEKDGSISSVQAEGDNFTFNRQAEIALYLLPERFSPAFINGTAIRYRFRLPVAMDFDYLK